MSDKFYREVKSATSRFSDMPSILQSMKDKGTLDVLSSCVLDVFKKEVGFAHKRLKTMVNVMVKDGQKINFQDQFMRNIEIFKSNFNVILDILVQKLWQEVIVDYTTDVASPRLTFPKDMQSSDLTISQNFSNYALLSPTNNKNSKSKHMKTFGSKQKISDDDIRNYSGISKSSVHSPSNMRSISKSKMQNGNNSISSMRSYNSKNGGPVPFSEISCISGSPSTFNRAIRNLDNSLTTVSPGVGRYEKIESGDRIIRESSPSFKMNKASKISWMEETQKKQDSQSPGPKYEVSKLFLSRKTSAKK